MADTKELRKHVSEDVKHVHDDIEHVQRDIGGIGAHLKNLDEHMHNLMDIWKQYRKRASRKVIAPFIFLFFLATRASTFKRSFIRLYFIKIVIMYRAFLSIFCGRTLEALFFFGLNTF